MAKLKTQFNDLVDASSIEAEIATKANKIQEAFITPTLLNSWANFSETLSSAQFYKDNFGVVHIKGVVKFGASGTTIFTLPTGYRPSQTRVISGYVSTTTGDVIGAVEITNAGVVKLYYSGTLTYFSIENISFRIG
jgi:hypothetical protein